MVILSDDDMAELPSASSREIAVEKFVPSDQIDPMLLEKSYYLEPEKSGAKPYAPAAPGAARGRPDGRGDRRAAPAHLHRGAAGQGRRDRAADDDVARRDPGPRLLGRDRRGQGRRGQDGHDAGRDPGRRLRRQRVRGRLRRRRRGAGQDQDRGRRDQADADLDQDLRRGRRPARRAAALGRRREEGPRRGLLGRRGRASEEKPAKKTASKRTTTKKAAAKKSATKKTAAKKSAAKKKAS